MSRNVCISIEQYPVSVSENSYVYSLASIGDDELLSTVIVSPSLLEGMTTRNESTFSLRATTTDREWVAKMLTVSIFAFDSKLECRRIAPALVASA